MYPKLVYEFLEWMESQRGDPRASEIPPKYRDPLRIALQDGLVENDSPGTGPIDARDVYQRMASVDPAHCLTRKGRGERARYRLQTRGRQKGRRRKDEKTAATKVLAALAKHHELGENGSVAVQEPAALKRLADLAGVSKQTVSRFLGDKLGKPEQYRRYKAKCNQDQIGPLLAIWRGEVPTQVAELFEEEYDRRGPGPPGKPRRPRP
jgi:hypothetical protein